METIKSFFSDYGYSFLMMVIIGSAIALILEITVKKAIDWLVKKNEGHEKALAVIPFIKVVSIQLCTWLMVLVFTKLLVENMPLPANKAFYPIWICIVYVLQYVFSCWGIKGILNFISKKAKKAEARAEAKALAKAKEAEATSRLEKVEGYTSLYRNMDTGEFCDEKGRRV